MSAAIVSARAMTIAQELRAIAQEPVPRLRPTARYVVTGGGLSEGPARFCVAHLRQRCGAIADFVPQSDFFVDDYPSSPDTTLIMFSQGLAPNARLPLLHAHRFAQAVIVTAMRAEQIPTANVLVAAHRPAAEEGLLLRVIGPTLAIATATRLCEALGGPTLDFSEVAARYAAALAEKAPALVDDRGVLSPVALVAGGRYAEFAFPLRWKLLEGLHLSDPPVWDLLQVAHGPFQSFYDHSFTLLGLVRHDCARDTMLLDRVEKMLVPGRHRLFRLASSDAGPSGWFEHDARCNRLVIDALATTGIDLAAWPGKGQDGPIYDVAPETLRG